MARRPWGILSAGLLFALSIIVGAYRAGRAVALREFADLASSSGDASCPPRATQCPPCGTSLLDIWKGARKPKRRMLIQAGGVAHDGIGSTLKFLKETVAIARVLDLDVGFTQSALNRDYKVTSLLKADTLDQKRLCDLHTVMLKDPAFGPFDVRVQRADAELNVFRKQVRAHCDSGALGSLELLPHMRERLEECDIIIWADQRVRIEGTWNECTRSWLRKALGSKQARPKSVGLHYRWGDLSWTNEGKWRYDDEKVEKILRDIRGCDQGWDVSVYMEASHTDETPEEKAAHLSPIRNFDRIVDSGDGMQDLGSLATHEILILNSGSYSEAAAAASDASIIITNGFFPVYEYLRQTSTRLLTVDQGAELDWCQTLRDLG